MENKDYIYGYSGLCTLLNASKPTVWRILKSGILDKAVSQIGRKIVIDKALALQILQKK